MCPRSHLPVPARVQYLHRSQIMDSKALFLCAIVLCLVASTAHAAKNIPVSSAVSSKLQGVAAAANPTDPCQGKADAQSCDALDECTWCKSAAVPSSCFTVVSLALA